MPGPPIAAVASDASLPARVDTVVIGGGIAGVTTALELTERGHAVAVCEKGEIGAEQSSRNWGWIRVSRRDAREVELVLESQRLWQGLDRRLGESVGYSRSGIVFAASDERELARQEAWLATAEPYQVRARMLDRGALSRLLPNMTLPAIGALHTEDDGYAEPQLAAPAIARACARLGAHVLTRCAVRGIERAAGRVEGVVTERGTIRCDSVVLAGGAWSGLFCANLGLRLPQLKLVASAMRTAPIDGGPEGALWTRKFSLRKRGDGGYTVANGHHNVAELVPDSIRYLREFLPALRQEWGSLDLRLGRETLRELRTPRRWAPDAVSPFELARTLDPVPVRAPHERALRALAESCPAFANATVTQMWAGIIDVTPDAVPVISAVDEIPGLHVATGFSGHGFGIGPGAGRLMADIVTGSTPTVDPHHFRFSRFSDGSPIALDGGV